MSKPYATQVIGAAKVIDNLKAVAIATIPTTESQARPLSKLPAEDQPEAWTRAVEQAESEGRNVTAKDVEAAVVEILPPKQKEEEYKPSNGMMYADMAISSLSKIEKIDTERKDALRKVMIWIEDHK